MLKMNILNFELMNSHSPYYIVSNEEKPIGASERSLVEESVNRRRKRKLGDILQRLSRILNAILAK